MGKSVAGLFVMLIGIVLWNVYREHGPDGLRSWMKAKFLNSPDPKFQRSA